MNNINRKEQQLPPAVTDWGWKYHHIGIPRKQIFENERYIPHLKMYVSGFEKSPFGVEWMRFEPDSPVHPLVQKVPHLAFEVENIEAELENKNLTLITPPNSPMERVRVAMIEYDGAPVELIEFNRTTKNY